MKNGMDTFRRLVAWERRMEIPANRAMFRFWQWAFVSVGPFAAAFGIYALGQEFWWQGCLLALLGLWWTWTGWTNLVRFARSHLWRDSLTDGERPEAVQSTSSEHLPLGSRAVRPMGGSVLIAAGVLIVVAALAR